MKPQPMYPQYLKPFNVFLSIYSPTLLAWGVVFLFRGLDSRQLLGLGATLVIGGVILWWLK